MRRRGNTVIEILVTCAVVALLVGAVIVLVRHRRGMETPGGLLYGRRGPDHRATCLSQVRQIGLAMRMYADQNKNFFPRSTQTGSPGVADSFAILVRTNYLDDARVLRCPSDPLATTDPFDPDVAGARPDRSNCSYSVDMTVKQTDDPSTALISDDPEGTANSINHGKKRGAGTGLGEGQNVFRAGGDAKFFLTVANGPDDSIFTAGKADNDSHIVDFVE